MALRSRSACVRWVRAEWIADPLGYGLLVMGEVLGVTCHRLSLLPRVFASRLPCLLGALLLLPLGDSFVKAAPVFQALY